MRALPENLVSSMFAVEPGLPKRERTRRQLLAAALGVFSARGIAAATMQEIAVAAGMTVGTVYNHFSTKEDIARQLGVRVAETLSHGIAESQKNVDEGARRMAIGNRRYLWLAETSPEWAMLLLEFGEATPEFSATLEPFVLADLRLGVRQKAFRVASEAVALDLIRGTIAYALRRIAAGHAPPRHAIAATATVLRGLGMDFDEALAVARMPLPELPLQRDAPRAR